MNRIFVNAAAVIVLVFPAFAQDPKERAYFVPVLNPKHVEKPKVAGWAEKRIEEKPDRGLAAVRRSDGKVYLSWRLLKNDPVSTVFDVYREIGGDGAAKINSAPIRTTTDYLDAALPIEASTAEIRYRVNAIVDGEQIAPSAEAVVKADSAALNYRLIKLQGNYRPQRMGIGDLDGDGSYDFVIKQPLEGIDPAGRPNTQGLTYKLEAYRSDGTFLWQVDLGPGIEPGIWYSPFVVYDFDGDGKAEVAVKTGPHDARESDGRVRSGREWVSILDGMTGKEITRADWPGRDPRLGDYNRINRNQIGVAFLDGKTPCLLVARGTYKLMVLDAYQYHGNALKRLWHWEGDDEEPIIRSQGAHGMHSADVDEDGRDEVILGSVVVDDNGTALYSVGLGHPDKCFVTDIDPSRPGMEILYGIEPWHDDGMGICLVEARTGKTIWSLGRPTKHIGDAMVADIDAAHPGLECFAAEDSKGGSREKFLLSATGKLLGQGPDVPGCRNWIFWDGDLLRESIEGGGWGRRLSIVKYKGPAVDEGIEGAVLLMADLFGDWREELVVSLPGELRIHTTTIPAKDRRACLMQDPVYRAEVAHRSMGYEQSPVTGYYLGEK